MNIRLAEADDLPAIVQLLTSAFPTDAEARLVERLCAAGQDELALVATSEEFVVGHCLFSPVTIHQGNAIAAIGLGLAPVAVLPSHQRQGVGSALINAGLQALAAAGCPFVVVLGEPAYYHRFGFVTASTYRLENEYGVDEPFMVLELIPAALPRDGGLVQYGAEFAGL